MAASEVINYPLVSVYVLGLVFVNFDMFFRDDLLALNLYCLGARDNISLMSCIRKTATLKGF